MIRRKASFGIGGLSFWWSGKADFFAQYARMVITVRALFLAAKEGGRGESLKPMVLQKGTPKREMIEKPSPLHLSRRGTE
jgi:hypothetical protein